MNEDIYSPNQSYKITLSSYEIKMSHWVAQPYLIRLSDDVTLFSLKGDPWSAFTVKWLDDVTVEMELARYPGRTSARLILQPAIDQATATTYTSSFSGTLSEVSRWILDL
ncbi:hypothetical protein IC229_26600 [Spirosoma sp. BT702]|uniref:Uncharacterized protein n=1 Tax=Spirosoma profusum TaxID=2771354 RepID=A0A926Y0J4_9BACT|nr:hypothetical protein [Spirosoma profusum]MBD2704242.1 hypothetical protein [Spirosoma profusum]